jgi:cytochrome c
MKMTRSAWLQILIVAVFALAALLLVRLHNAGGATLPLNSASAGHRLAEAWCKDCHAIDAATAAGRANGPPDFTAIANRASTTALSLKVFFQTAHRSMPNLIIAPDQADDLASYILSLRRD